MPRQVEPVVVITGASSGIGRTTALAFARRRARLVLVARRPGALQETAAEASALGGRCTVVQADVTDPTQVQRVATTAVTQHGSIDVWVNAAGITPRLPLHKTTRAELDRALAVNFHGAVHGISAALSVMRPAGQGTIVTVGSLTCIRGAPERAAYSASKHALKGYVEAARVELRRTAPGVVLTLVHPGAVAGARQPRMPRHRFAQRPHAPEAVAAAIIFAASHSRRDIYVGTGRVLALLEGVAPSLLDWLYARATATDDSRHAADLDAAPPAATNVVRPRKRSLTTMTIEYHPRLAGGITLLGALGSALALVLIRRRAC
jgi:NAD(P)-dependent dehydrogenase (short-subunit alcohol dehydrogenase family)